jgi:hypothetical protein
MSRKESNATATVDTKEITTPVDGATSEVNTDPTDVNSSENSPPAMPSKPVSHVVISSDGGAGKSTTARMLCARYDSKGIIYQLIDADSKKDVCNSYAPELYKKWAAAESNLDAGNDDNDDDFLKTQIQLYDTKATVGGEGFGDRLIMLACASNTIVNLPGNSLQALCSWIDSNFLSDRKLPFDLVFWWVSNGSPGDQEAFAKFVTQYPKLTHCIVFNEYHVNNWDKFKPIKRVADLIEKEAVKTVRLLPQRNRDNVQIIEGGKTFQQLMDSMHPFMGETLSQWLNKNWTNLEETGLLI